MRRARRLGLRKPVRAPAPVSGGTGDIGELPNPYGTSGESLEEMHQDLILVHEAWKRHYKVDELPDDFVPPFLHEDNEGLKFDGWIGVFRDLMIEKYGSLDAADARIRYVVALMMTTGMERRLADSA